MALNGSNTNVEQELGTAEAAGMKTHALNFAASSRPSCELLHSREVHSVSERKDNSAS